MHHLGTGKCAEVFAQGTGEDVNHAHDNHQQIAEYAQLQLRAADDEKQRQQGIGPPVGFLHDVLGKGADVAEDGAQHHAHQQGGKADGDGAQVEFMLSQGHGEEHKGDGHVQAVGVGIEQLFQLSQHPAGNRAQGQGADDFHQGIDQDGNHIHRAGGEGLGHAEGDGEHHQTHRVVQGHNGQKQVYQLALGLVLAHHHQRGGGGGGGADGAQGDGLRRRELIREQGAEDQKRDVDEHRRHQRLENADDRGRPAGLLQGGQAEFGADGEGDEAQRHVGHQRKFFHICKAGESQAVYAQKAQAVWAHQYAGDQIAGDRGQAQGFEYPGHHQTRQNGNGQGKKRVHADYLRFFS